MEISEISPIISLVQDRFLPAGHHQVDPDPVPAPPAREGRRKAQDRLQGRRKCRLCSDYWLQSGLEKGILEHARSKGKKGSGSFKVVDLKRKKAKVAKEGGDIAAVVKKAKKSGVAEKKTKTVVAKDKKPALKKTAKTAVVKKVAKKAVPKSPAAAKKPSAKSPAVKKTVAKKTTAKGSAANKTAPKKTAKSPATKKTAKSPATKKTVKASVK